MVKLINSYTIRLDLWTRRYPLRVFFVMLTLGMLVCMVANSQGGMQ